MSKSLDFFVEYPDLNVFWRVVKGVKVFVGECDKIREVESWVRENFSLEKLVEHPIVRSLRDFMWSIGIDPTKERPSSEALVRRILRRGRLPRINIVVDCGNAASAKTLIPLSIFDLDKIVPPIKLVASKGGEEILAIGNKRVKLGANFPILIDSSGKIFSATLYRDSEETKVTEKTKNILVVGYAPKDVPISNVRRAVNLTVELIDKCIRD